MWMSHVTHMNESCHTWMSHVTHMNESCHTCRAAHLVYDTATYVHFKKKITYVHMYIFLGLDPSPPPLPLIHDLFLEGLVIEVRDVTHSYVT